MWRKRSTAARARPDTSASGSARSSTGSAAPCSSANAADTPASGSARSSIGSAAPSANAGAASSSPHSGTSPTGARARSAGPHAGTASAGSYPSGADTSTTNRAASGSRSNARAAFGDATLRRPGGHHRGYGSRDGRARYFWR